MRIDLRIAFLARSGHFDSWTKKSSQFVLASFLSLFKEVENTDYDAKHSYYGEFGGNS